MDMAENLGVEFELKDIDDDAVAVELIEKGGKRQVPYLVDTEKDTAMYESGDIIDYIRDNYAGTANVVSKPRVHMSDATCVSCEG